MRAARSLQLDVVGGEIDHVAVMDMAEMDGGQRRQHVEARSSARCRRPCASSRQSAPAAFRSRMATSASRSSGASLLLAMAMVAAPPALGLFERRDGIGRRAAGRNARSGSRPCRCRHWRHRRRGFVDVVLRSAGQSLEQASSPPAIRMAMRVARNAESARQLQRIGQRHQA